MLKQAVFFDIGDTLGVPIVEEGRLVDFVPYDYIQSVLEFLLTREVRIGIISNTGSETEKTINDLLKKAEIYDFFEQKLLLYSSVIGLKKDSPEIFKLAAKEAGYETPEEKINCIFVGEDKQERVFALEANFRVALHPLLLEDILDNDQLTYCIIRVPKEGQNLRWRNELRKRRVVPLQVSGEQGTTVYAISSYNTILNLIDLGFYVEKLGRPNDPLTTDLYLLRDDRQKRTGFLNPIGQSQTLFGASENSEFILSSDMEGLLVAIPQGSSIENFHFEDASHGHTLKLIPDMGLLNPFGMGINSSTESWLLESPTELSLSSEAMDAISHITPDLIKQFIDRYTGLILIKQNSDKKIQSRHIHNSDNENAANALIDDFNEIGNGKLTVNTHYFKHEGRSLSNIVAELKGKTDKIVMVTAHLDSTAAFTPPIGSYNPLTDPAPGADDDASGLAGVMVICKTILEIYSDSMPERTIRFALFNAEEHGLVGSKAYAKEQAALKRQIIAVFQMDMIGYNKKPPLSWEVHVGYPPDPDVQDRSGDLACRLRRYFKEVSPDLLAPEIYDLSDPAAGRSDHASFQERGYAACAVSEDFFADNHGNSDQSEPNPNYHKETDTFVDYEYAAHIARAVAAGAWVTVNLK